MERSSGVLMHISSLPSPYGIGTFGAEAYSFADFLADSGQKYWQVLPLSPTGYGDSPYQAFSSAAGNPLFIDLDLLCEDGLLDKAEVRSVSWGDRADECDYGRLFENRYALLRPVTALVKERCSAELADFCGENSDWLDDYALFMALKYKLGQLPWYRWPENLRRRDSAAIAASMEELTDEISFFKCLQFLFSRQWEGLKKYANDKGIGIIGDIPIYVPYDSADVWSNQSLFLLDGELRPISVSGCPPDSFTADGQLWGTPVYDWEAHGRQGYDWWVRRIERQLRLYDVLRIDHFRGFDAYYAIPFGAENGRFGEWKNGPGMELFNVLREKLGELPIIAEDLGFLTPTVKRLLSDSGFPGMRVMQFAFDGDSDNCYLPHNYIRSCVAYLGTHDNDTTEGWFSSASEAERLRAGKYIRLHTDESPSKAMLCTLLGSVAELTVVTMQDILGLGSEARMNTPGTKSGNWRWRLRGDEDYGRLSLWLRDKTVLYGRL